MVDTISVASRMDTYLYFEAAMAKKYNTIKAVLEKQGKTQSWLADQLDVQYNTINRYCTNRRQPSIELLFKIAQILKVNPRDLLNS
jgi:putative transcriptional regulator